MTRKAYDPENNPAQKAALDAYVKKIVDEWPPLTNEQLDKLAVLLRPQPGRIEPSGASAVERMLGDDK